MSDQQLLQRISSDPKVMVGKPVIKGTRLTVELILNLLAPGSTVEEILDEYGGLPAEDVQACLLFALHSLSSTAFIPLLSRRKCNSSSMNAPVRLCLRGLQTRANYHKLWTHCRG